MSIFLKVQVINCKIYQTPQLIKVQSKMNNWVLLNIIYRYFMEPFKNNDLVLILTLSMEYDRRPRKKLHNYHKGSHIYMTWRQISLLNKQFWKMSISTCGRMKLELYFLFATIINTKYLKVFIKSPHSKTEKNASIFVTIKAI